MCEYCEEKNKTDIAGKEFEVIPTNTLESKSNYDKLNCFILKGKEDEQAGIMIGTYEGYSFININYCPICGRKL